MPLLFFETLILLVKAVFIRRRGSACLRLPTVAKAAISADKRQSLVAQVNRLTNLVAGKSRHACWYRCYPLVVLLRKRGVAAQLNIGLMGLQPRQELRGHCWLSLESQVFNELDDVSSAAYPEFLGDNGFGAAYWVKAGQGQYVSRKFG